MHYYRKKTIKFLIGFLIIFFIVFILSFISFKKNVAIFQIGLKYYSTDMVVMLFSVIAIIYTLYEIIRVEHAIEYEERLKWQEQEKEK